MTHESRREFLSGLARYGPVAAGLSCWCLPSCAKGGNAAKGPSKVIVPRNDGIRSGQGVNVDVVEKMLDDAVMKLTAAGSAAAAWSSLFHKSDRVGIKVNTLAGARLSPHVGLVDAIVRGLRKAGVSSSAIIVWDRANRELQRAGYKIEMGRRSLKCFGTDALPGGGYEPDVEFAGSVGSCFSQILTRHCSALVNVPILKDHDLAGVSLGMKNFFGAIHNPNKYHDNHCDPYVADLNAHPYIRNKLRLIVCDAVTPQCEGGPAFKPQWSWPFNGMLVSRDPVALDQVGTMIIEQQRKAKRLPSLKQVGREPTYIATAAKHGLGVCDPKLIRIVNA